ncbi:TetR/AcrR family transcriptional regulator [Actinoplanes sp. TBRC 11911]|uniref:TetR/AcrR family transcriptional regulator n=1 Tax=Actinoplanes sp. TBRC 11911 TaxID=2729386 RepID=UPI001B7D67EB|nr:TetR/AcrR family transcriptional regulator [Actinoplanes sp. TBRC 11911]
MSRSTAGRPGLDPDVIVKSALAIADTEGIDAVTIRRLAQEHQVTPMALYRHFKDKDDLLQALADRLLADIVVPDADDRPWHEQMRSTLTALIAALRPHPDVAHLTVPRLLTSAPGLALAERCLVLLVSGGFDIDRAAEVARSTLFSLVALVAAEPRLDPRTEKDDRDDAIAARRAALATLPVSRYPNVVAAAGTLSYCEDADHYYQIGLDLTVAAMIRTSPGR